MGGLARRAGFFQSRREKSSRSPEITIAGAHEFQPFKPGTRAAPPGLTKALYKAYAALGYDMICLTPEERDLLAKSGLRPPKSWLVLESDPVEKEIEVQGSHGQKVAVGVLVFPRLPLRMHKVPGDIAQAVAKAAQRLRKRAEVVIGVSDWSAKAEKHFLKTDDGAVDLLFSSGPGPGLVGELSPSGRTFWSRAYPRGLAVMTVQLMERPSERTGGKWTKQGNLKLRLAPLGGDVASDPDTYMLMAPFRNP